MTESQILAAHLLHVEGMSIPEIGRQVWERFGYTSAHTATRCISRLFENRGLWIRSRAEASSLASRTHGLRTNESKEDPSVTRAYRRQLWRERHGVSERCAGLIRASRPARGVRAGERCAKFARSGSKFCSRHETRRGS